MILIVTLIVEICSWDCAADSSLSIDAIIPQLTYHIQPKTGFDRILDLTAEHVFFFF